MKFRVPALVAVAVCCAAVAHAQAPLKLQISGGRVTLHAQNVPVRTILAEWARLGGARIVNGDRIAGAPLTLDLEGVPERQALDIILRGVSGFMLASREPGSAGASMYDRIMILPTSVAPRTPPPANAAPIFSGPPGGVVRPPVVPRQVEDQNGNDDGDAAQGNDGVPLARPLPFPRPVAGAPVGAPVMPPVTVAPDPPQAPAPVVVTPSNPFGVPAGSSVRPGVITPAPQAPQQVPPRPGPQD
jgi:hypothetical protein